MPRAGQGDKREWELQWELLSSLGGRDGELCTAKLPMARQGTQSCHQTRFESLVPNLREGNVLKRWAEKLDWNSELCACPQSLPVGLSGKISIQCPGFWEAHRAGMDLTWGTQAAECRFLSCWCSQLWVSCIGASLPPAQGVKGTGSWQQLLNLPEPSQHWQMTLNKPHLIYTPFHLLWKLSCFLGRPHNKIFKPLLLPVASSPLLNHSPEVFTACPAAPVPSLSPVWACGDAKIKCQSKGEKQQLWTTQAAAAIKHVRWCCLHSGAPIVPLKLFFIRKEFLEAHWDLTTSRSKMSCSLLLYCGRKSDFEFKPVGKVKHVITIHCMLDTWPVMGELQKYGA